MAERELNDYLAAFAVGAALGIGAYLLLRGEETRTDRLRKRGRQVRKRLHRSGQDAAGAARDMAGTGRDLLGAFRDEAAAIVDTAREEIVRAARDGAEAAGKEIVRSARRGASRAREAAEGLRS